MEFPYCPQNELVAKQFLSKFHQFEWIAKKVKSLFSFKDRNPKPVCKIYKGTCVCDETYIGETIKNVDIRSNEPEGKNARNLSLQSF